MELEEPEIPTVVVPSIEGPWPIEVADLGLRVGDRLVLSSSQQRIGAKVVRVGEGRTAWVAPLGVHDQAEELQRTLPGLLASALGEDAPTDLRIGIEDLQGSEYVVARFRLPRDERRTFAHRFPRPTRAPNRSAYADVHLVEWLSTGGPNRARIADDGDYWSDISARPK